MLLGLQAAAKKNEERANFWGNCQNLQTTAFYLFYYSAKKKSYRNCLYMS